MKRNLEILWRITTNGWREFWCAARGHSVSVYCGSALDNTELYPRHSRRCPIEICDCGKKHERHLFCGGVDTYRDF